MSLKNCSQKWGGKMDLLKHEEIASVNLFDLRLSESELMIYEGCIDYVLKTCSEKEILKLTGCENKTELSWFQEDLKKLIMGYVSKRFLLERYK